MKPTYNDHDRPKGYLRAQAEIQRLDDLRKSAGLRAELLADYAGCADLLLFKWLNNPPRTLQIYFAMLEGIELMTGSVVFEVVGTQPVVRNIHTGKVTAVYNADTRPEGMRDREYENMCNYFSNL
jgi:hypothetical protein